MKPRYEHDCTKCQFLGYYGEFDVYVHYWENGSGNIYPDYVFRFSNDAPDYFSRTFNPREYEATKLKYPYKYSLDSPEDLNLWIATYLMNALIWGRLARPNYKTL